MIANYSLSFTKEKIEKETRITLLPSRYIPIYNIYPKKEAMIVCQDKPHAYCNAYWGLVPHWSKSGNITGNLYNADIQGISSKTSFRIPIRSKRCIIPADSYYVIEKNKKAFRIHQKENKMIFIAGLYDDWQNSQIRIRTFTMLTRRIISQKLAGSSEAIILKEKEKDLWLDSRSSLNDIIEMLSKSDQSHNLRFYQITNKIADPKFNTADIHEPFKEEMTLFS